MTQATLEDRTAFQRVRRALAEVLKAVGEDRDAQPSKATVAALARAHKAAERAVYPTEDARELALMRQWMRLVESYVGTPIDLERRLHIGALSTLQMDVALILGPSVGDAPVLGPPPPPYWAD